jgi:hypothetical protein
VVGCGPGQRGLGLGDCLGEGDVETEGLEVAEVGADLAVAVGLALVPPGAEVAEPGAGVGQQVPDDDEDGPADRALSADAPDAPGQAAEPLAEEGVRAGRAQGGLGAVALQVRVAPSLFTWYPSPGTRNTSPSATSSCSAFEPVWRA